MQFCVISFPSANSLLISFFVKFANACFRHFSYINIVLNLNFTKSLDKNSINSSEIVSASSQKALKPNFRLAFCSRQQLQLCLKEVCAINADSTSLKHSHQSQVPCGLKLITPSMVQNLPVKEWSSEVPRLFSIGIDTPAHWECPVAPA
jgi:hypothetical protein